jgi:hypothetical protein
MTPQELKDYRKILEKEYSDKDLEIETSLSYITIGALGFFLTINDKFLKLQDAKFTFLLIISLVSLFLSFVLILFRKSRTIKHDVDMMKFVDRMATNSPSQDKELTGLWNKCNKELTFIRTLIYIGLASGIGLQILYLLLNF